MDECISIIFLQSPRPRESHRSFQQRTGKIKTYDPQSKVLMALRKEVLDQLPVNFETFNKDSPVQVHIECNFNIPRSWPNAKKEKTVQEDWAHISAPDCDNLAKLYLDALKGIVFEDDSQVCYLSVTKKYTDLIPLVFIKCKKIHSQLIPRITQII